MPTKAVFVKVSLQVEGIHRWPECDIPEVDFLRHPHRHMFHMTCTKRVTHQDRDVEIIELKRDVEAYLRSFRGNFGNMSCEMIAELLVDRYDLASCEVLEDGENGALVCLSQ